MLVLTRKAKEEIRIGNDITVTIVRVKGQSVRIGINAPDHVHIMRSELTNQEKPTSSEKAPRSDSNVNQKPDSSRSPMDGTTKPNPKNLEVTINDRTVTDLTANSPMMKRLENQLSSRPNNETPATSNERFQSPLGSTDSFSRVFGRTKLDRAHRAADDSENS